MESIPNNDWLVESIKKVNIKCQFVDTNGNLKKGTITPNEFSPNAEATLDYNYQYSDEKKEKELIQSIPIKGNVVLNLETKTVQTIIKFEEDE